MSYQTRRAERIAKIVSEVYKRIDNDILNEVTPPGIQIGLDDLTKANPDTISKIAAKTDINVVDKIHEADEVTELKDVSEDIIIKGRKVYVLVDVASPGEEVEFTHNGKTFTAIVSDEPKGASVDERLLKDIKQKKNASPKTNTSPNAVPTANSTEDKAEKEVADTQQENAIYNLKNWATQLQIPIGDGESAPNGAIKFTYFNQADQSPIVILVLSNGLIKMSGHDISDFSDFSNIIKWHQANS